ncbi:ubinuclein-1-like [Dendronephthya gigantea]|uniref:ubinuclein-1-like n=1 Tax=Dendronephthya gigantea TaxID=151771 RepID=UPI0010692193|nr:ubinuclein-1-like [Dendronephthya gigantea]
METENKSKTESTKSFAQREKIKERVSVRFHLELTDSTDRSFPEFSYLELLGTNKNKKKDEGVLHDGECDVDEIRALAKKFEDKYGPKSGAKKSKAHKTDRVQDLVDVTYGYDATDAFVDDSEAYDELVPADWTTEHGGFYINMGELNFRPFSSGDERSDGDFKETKKKTPKKKNKENKEKKLKDGKRHLSSGEKEKSSKKMRLNSDEKESKLQKLKKRINLSAGKSKEGTSGSTVQQDKNKQSKTVATENLQSPVIKVEKNSVTDMRNSAPSIGSSALSEDSLISKENENSLNNSPSVSLPDGLPPSLILSIQKLIEVARKAGGEAGKCKFFNSDVNRILLQIETDSRKLNCRARSAVYDYLALFLPCTKDTLLKRAKNLFMQEQVGRLREPLLKLRLAIEAAMPAQVKNYEEEVAKLSEEQAVQNLKPFTDTVNQNGEKKDDVVMKDLEVEGENEKIDESTTPTDVNAPTTPSEEKGKRTFLPKRFVWKDDIRNLLCDVVGIKVELYLMSKSRSTTAEEALKGFLETEVRPLWPKGWMTTRILYRESKQAHAKVTSTVAAKVKKDPKRPKEEGSKIQDSNQQVTAMVIDQGNDEATPLKNLANMSTSSVPSYLKSNTAFTNTPVAMRPDALNIATDKQNIELKTSVQSKIETEIPVKIAVETPLVKPQDEPRVRNLLKLEGASVTKVQDLLQSQIKLRKEAQLKLQSKTQAQTQVMHEDEASLGKSHSEILEKQDQALNENLARSASQDTLEKTKIPPSHGSLPLPTPGKTPKPQEQKNSHLPNNLELKFPSLPQGQSIHDQTSNQSLIPSQSHDHSALKPPQNALQNPIKALEKPQSRQDDDDSSLRKLLGIAEPLGREQPPAKEHSHMQLQGHINNHARVQSNVSAQVQVHLPTAQNAQANAHVQSHGKPITQQTVQGKGRGQSLTNAHNQTQVQSKSIPYRQSQLESQNRIQNQLQGLTYPQGQMRSQSQFHAQPREDQGHPLSQVQSKSPSSPRVPAHANTSQRMQASFSSPTNISKPKAAGKTILDFLDEASPLSPFHNTPESRPLSHVTSASPSLSSCSFQNTQQHQISPPRNIKTQNNMPTSSPPLSSPNRHPIRNVSPIRQMSTNAGTFSNINVSKRLSSCSLQNIPSKINQETSPSPRSPRQGYNFLTKVPSSPNLSCQFPMQPSRTSPESHARSSSHLNTLTPNFMTLSSSDKPKTQLTATSLLNSLASMSQNHLTPNLPLVGQPSNSLQNNGLPMTNSSLNISPIMNVQNNLPNNKAQQGPGFPGNMKNFTGMPQFSNQQPMLRNNLPAEMNDGNNRISNFQPAYRPFS